MHTYYIDKIVKSDDNKKMEELRQLLIDTITYLKGTDYDKYKDIECKLYEIVEGRKLTEEKAIEWVESMIPKSKWTLEEIKDLKKKKEVNVPDIAAYVIMNMLYSDFGDVLGEEMTDSTIDKYIKATEDWYYDEDAIKTEDEKLYCYWKNIIN